jgi:hypothetical protein
MKIKLRPWEQSLKIAKIIEPDEYDTAELLCYIPGELFGRYLINAIQITSDLFQIEYKGEKFTIPLYFISKIINE